MRNLQGSLHTITLMLSMIMITGKIPQSLPGIKHLTESSALVPYTPHTSGKQNPM